MKRYLLNSGPLAAFLLGRKLAVDTIAPWVIRREVATSIIAYAEVTEYIKGLSDSSRRHNDLKRMLSEVYPYFLIYSILDRYADIRRRLRPPYGEGLIGDMDTLIAATALERNLTLVTVDHDFERVAGLRVIFMTTR